MKKLILLILSFSWGGLLCGTLRRKEIKYVKDQHEKGEKN